MMQMKEYEEVPQDVPSARAAAGVVPEQWMSIPVGSNCPRGLEYLTVLDQLFVAQKIEAVEVVTGYEKVNRFKVKNPLGQNVYYGCEDSNAITRQLLGRLRPFEMKIEDSLQNEVMHLHRPFAMPNFCCFPKCKNMLEVSAPPGQVIGTIEEVQSCIEPRFRIRNSYGEILYKIQLPICLYKCCADINMKVINRNGETIGKVTKQYPGYLRDVFTDGAYFSVTFPLSLDVRMKAMLFASVFLLDVFFNRQ